jgi:ArsR family transcriptional regulator
MQSALRQFKADIFQALAHPTRIAIVELLRDGEVPAGAIFAQVGVEQANASQHLAVLRAKRLVSNRKVGNQVFYALRSHRLVEVLDAMRLYFEEHLSEAMEMLAEIKLEAPAPAVASEEQA